MTHDLSKLIPRHLAVADLAVRHIGQSITIPSSAFAKKKSRPGLPTPEVTGTLRQIAYASPQDTEEYENAGSLISIRLDVPEHRVTDPIYLRPGASLILTGTVSERRDLPAKMLLEPIAGTSELNVDIRDVLEGVVPGDLIYTIVPPQPNQNTLDLVVIEPDPTQEGDTGAARHHLRLKLQLVVDYQLTSHVLSDEEEELLIEEGRL